MTRFKAGYEILVGCSIERSQCTDPVARRTAEHVINGRLRELAHEVERGHVDAGLRARGTAELNPHYFVRRCRPSGQHALGGIHLSTRDFAALPESRKAGL